MSSYTLDAFLREVADAVAATPEGKSVTDPILDAMRRLVAAPYFLDDAMRRPSVKGPARHLLHRDPGRGFLVTAVVFAPGQATPIHDHAGFGVVGSLQGRLVASHYRRLDDGQTAGYASLAEVSRVLVSDSSFAVTRPGEEDAHRLENPYREPAVTVHVFAAETPQRRLYDLAQKTVIEADAEELLGV